MKFKLIAILASFLMAISGAVSAQDQDNAPDSGTPEPANNSSAVARLSLIHGDVSTQRGDSGEWSAATLNSPVVGGDHVSTGDRSRAELQLDHANVLRLDERTQASIVSLERNQMQIQLGQGRANFTVLRNSDANVEIDSPNVAVHPDRRDGSYSVTVESDGRTEVIVRRGSVDVSTPQGSTRVESGQMITVLGSGDQTQYKTSDAPGKDDFDRWNVDRDHLILNAQSWRHTNGYYTGSEDLDAYGHWRDVPDYGSVWVPTVSAGWAPYRSGQWAWEPGWGWTWVSYEPWGWAPYHYGRWMYVDGGWGWWPGPVYANPYYYPVWAPAYVSFFGFGGGVGFGFGWGSIGWLPVGPCDHFYPWWGGYRSRFNTVNITNINVTNIYNNRGGWGALHGGERFSNVRNVVRDPGFRRSISTVPSNQFGHGRVTVQPVSREMFQNAHMVNGNLPVVPTRQSTQISGRPAAASTISNRTQNQRFFSNARPSAAVPRSFESERAQTENNIRSNSRFTPINGGQGTGNPRSTAAESNTRFGAPARPGLNSAAQPSDGIGRGNGSPARGFGGPNVNPAVRGEDNARSSATSGSANGSEWRRFGGPNGQGSTPGSSPARGFGGRSSDPAVRGEDNSRPTGNNNPAPRPNNDRPNNDRMSAPSRDSQGGWQKFTPMPSRPSGGESMGRGAQNESWRNAPSRPAPEPMNRASQNESWRNSRPADSQPRNYRNDSRPPLNMRQPIVTNRGGNYGEPSYSRPSYDRGPYGGNRGGYSAPAPSRGYSGPSGGGYSAPSHGGGYSAPSHGGYSAPSHSGYSAPSGHSGGGSHSGGGGSSHSNSSGHHGK